MNDGSVQGHRYFECAPFSGRFLRHSAVEFHSRPPPARSNAEPTRSQPSQPSQPQPTPPKPVRSSRPAARRPSASKTSRIPTSRVSTPRAAAGRVAGRTTPRRQVVSAGFRNRIEKGACGVKVRHCLLALSWCPVLRRAHGQRRPWCGLYRQGLRNLGNTCFMNAVLQTLLASPVWRGVLLRRAGRATPERRASTPGDEPEVRTKRLRRPKSGRGHRGTSGGVGGSGDGAITNALVQCVRLAGSCSQRGEAHECLGLRRLCEQVWLGHDAVVAPSKLFQALCRRVPHFRKRRQQDSVEAFRYLLDGVDRESRSRQASDTPTIHQGWMLSCRVPLGAADSVVCACVCVLCVRVSLRVLDLSVQQSVMCVSGRWSRASCVSAAATLVVALRSLLIFRCHYTPRQACLTERSDG